MPNLTLDPANRAEQLRNIALDLLRVVVYNTGIAIFLTLITDYGFGQNMVFSQAIGLSISIGVSLSCTLRGKDHPSFADALAGIPAGFACGFTIATWLTGLTLTEVVREHPRGLLMGAGSAVVFGIIASYYYINRMRMEDLRAEADRERLQRAEAASQAAMAELRMLQAQIEPHFLFNTLSVAIELIDSRPAGARAMLRNLVSLLRASMANMRRESVTLAQELDLLRAYLGIMGERMGARLAWEIEAEDAVLGISLPPLLVQPLVENAIRHGLEPQKEGGHLNIRCRREGASLVITVEDDGRGMGAQSAGGGVGLANIRERLASRYGNAASLSLLPQARGMLARLEVPA